MSIISQFAMVVIILMTGIIIFYANKSLKKAQEEGESFQNDWNQYILYKEKSRSVREKNSFPGASQVAVAEKNMTRSTEKKAGPAESPITLVLFDGDGNLLKNILVAQYPFYIGRNPKNHLYLDDIRIAEKHCIIYEEGNQVILKDLGTANKIMIEEGLVDECILQDQSRFSLGDYQFLVKKK